MNLRQQFQGESGILIPERHISPVIEDHGSHFATGFVLEELEDGQKKDAGKGDGGKYDGNTAHGSLRRWRVEGLPQLNESAFFMAGWNVSSFWCTKSA